MMSFSGKTGRWGLIVSGVAGLFPLATALAVWSLPTDAPVGRLVTNVTKYVQEHPKDAQGYYVLGRIHSVAFAKKSRTVSIWTRRDPLDERVLPNVAADYRQNDGRRFITKDRREPAPTREEFLKHLGASVAAYERAIELDASPAHYYLGLAYIIEIGASLAEEVAGLPKPAGNKPTDKQAAEIQKLIAALGDDKTPIRAQATVDLRGRLDQAAPILHRHRVDANPHVKEAVRELLRAYWRERAIAHYFSAFDRSINKNLTIEARPMSGLRTLVGYEAGTAFVRLVKSRGVRDDVEKGRLVFVESAIETLEAVPPSGAVTPIIFSLESRKPLCDLLASKQPVRFDLDGDGKAELWPWVKPSTGLLVWDPEDKRKITSGRQLFGSVTWWLFFTDGYRALDALDDDRDGWLSGAELPGLSVWFDRNTNGISDAGEVIPVCKLGIESIATTALSKVGDSPFNPAGLRMSDGRVLPTYDWVTSPVVADRGAFAERQQLGSRHGSGHAQE